MAWFVLCALCFVLCACACAVCACVRALVCLVTRYCPTGRCAADSGLGMEAEYCLNGNPMFDAYCMATVGVRAHPPLP